MLIVVAFNSSNIYSATVDDNDKRGKGGHLFNQRQLK